MSLPVVAKMLSEMIVSVLLGEKHLHLSRSMRIKSSMGKMNRRTHCDSHRINAERIRPVKHPGNIRVERQEAVRAQCVHPATPTQH